MTRCFSLLTFTLLLPACSTDHTWLDADAPLFPRACGIDRDEEMCDAPFVCPTVRVGGVRGCGEQTLSPSPDLDCVLEALQTRRTGMVKVEAGDPGEGCGHDDIIHILGDDSAIQWQWTYNFENSGGTPSDVGYRLRLKSAEFFEDCRGEIDSRPRMIACLLDWYDPTACNS